MAKHHVRTGLLTDHRMVDLYISKALKSEPVDITTLSTGERALAQTDKIMISQSTRDLAGHGLEAVDMGVTPVKGRKATVSVCLVTSLSTP